MKKCSECGNETSGNDVFCADCGGKMAEVCRKCGKPLEDGAKFCGVCGALTDGSSPRSAHAVPKTESGVSRQPKPPKSQDAGKYKKVAVLLALVALLSGSYLAYKYEAVSRSLNVLAPYLNIKSVSKNVGYITSSDVMLLSDMNDKTGFPLPIHTEVTILGSHIEEGKNWQKVTYDGKDGWVPTDCISLNREEASKESDSKVVGYISSGDVMLLTNIGDATGWLLPVYAEVVILNTVSEGGQSWQNVEYKGQKGWVPSGFIVLNKNDIDKFKELEELRKKLEAKKKAEELKKAEAERKKQLISQQRERKKSTGTRVYRASGSAQDAESIRQEALRQHEKEEGGKAQAGREAMSDYRQRQTELLKQQQENIRSKTRKRVDVYVY